MKPYLALLISICLFITPARAQDKADFSELIMTGEAQVEEIIDPLRIKLLDGRILQLVSIDIPDLTPYDTGDLGAAVFEQLKEKLVKKTIKIYQVKRTDKGRTNRMGYHLAHIVIKNSDEWIQGSLISQGLARVRPSTLNIEMAGQMSTLELKARQEQQGLWNPDKHGDTYAMLTPETAEKAMHGWAVIEGKVRANAMAKNTVFLNFGSDWRTDFTIGIPSKIRRELSNSGIDPMQFAHKTVRVRGWVEGYNGPYVELMHPVWLEIIDDLPAPSEGVSLGQ